MIAQCAGGGDDVFGAVAVRVERTDAAPLGGPRRTETGEVFKVAVDEHGAAAAVHAFDTEGGCTCGHWSFLLGSGRIS